MSSHSSHHPQEVLLAQFSLYVHKGGLKPDLFHFNIIQYGFHGRKNIISNMSQPSWWNKEYRQAKANKYALLNKFRQTDIEQDRQNYLESKNIFEMLCKENKRLEKENLKQKLILIIYDPRLFWRTLRESRTVAPVQNNISVFDWYSHFKSVLNQDIKIDHILKKLTCLSIQSMVLFMILVG